MTGKWTNEGGRDGNSEWMYNGHAWQPTGFLPRTPADLRACAEAAIALADDLEAEVVELDGNRQIRIVRGKPTYWAYDKEGWCDYSHTTFGRAFLAAFNAGLERGSK